MAFFPGGLEGMFVMPMQPALLCGLLSCIPLTTVPQQFNIAIDAHFERKNYLVLQLESGA